jgi:hypothetical protein
MKSKILSSSFEKYLISIALSGAIGSMISSVTGTSSWTFFSGE